VALTPRRALFWLHLAAGVIAGTVIFFLAVTGAFFAYQRQMIAFADRAHHVTASGTRQSSISSLVESAQSYAHAPATAITFHNDPEAPVEVTVGREPARVFLIDPYTAIVLGESAPRTRSFTLRSRLSIGGSACRVQTGRQRAQSKAPSRWRCSSLSARESFSGCRASGRDSM